MCLIKANLSVNIYWYCTFLNAPDHVGQKTVSSITIVMLKTQHHITVLAIVHVAFIGTI